ncbi:hypothetical protein GcM3_080033, partial [Golovinomyces cichoracearum]
FRANARKYNNSVAFTSFKYTADQRITGGLKSFAIHGKVYHYQANLGTETALTVPQVRANNEWTYGLNLSVVLLLDMVLREKNPWLARYRHAKEMVTGLLQEREGEQFRVLYNPRLQLIAEAQSGIHKGRIQLPTAPEVALLIPDEIDDGRSNCTRDLVVAERKYDSDGVEIQSNSLHTIHTSHASNSPLHYVILWPHGENGWHWALKLENNGGERRKNNRMSQRHYYRYLLSVRHTPQQVTNYNRSDTPIPLFNPFLMPATSLSSTVWTIGPLMRTLI